MKKYGMETNFGYPIKVERHDLNSSWIEHKHNYAELIIAVNGKATHIINGHNYPVRMGDVFIINPGTIHGMASSITLEECLVQYNSDILESIGPEIKSMSAFHTLFLLAPRYPAANYACRLKLDSFDLEKAIRICAKMESELCNKQEGCSAMLQALFCELAVFLCRRYNQPQKPDATSRSILQISKVTSYMESSFNTKFTLDDLAKIGTMSRRNLTRLFRQIHGISPLEYLIRLRVKRASYMLQNTEHNITAIAFICGFEDSNYFSRQFRSFFGVSPSQYRKP